MSFLTYLTQNINLLKKIVPRNRKERKDSQVTIIQKSLINYKGERASAFTFRGSLTLEASIVVPLFFFAILCLAYLLEIMAVQTTMRNALCSVGKEVAQKAYVNNYPTSREIERKMVENIGVTTLENSIIFGGAEGLDCSKTRCNRSTGVMDLHVRYEIEIPVFMFHISPIAYEESIRIKGWNGYVTTLGGDAEKEIVYVTETGIVYHKDAACTYLDMSIHMVRISEIDEVRNASGGKYYPCEACGEKRNDIEMYYITEYGTRYHTTLDCKKIQRNVYSIPIDEAYGLGGCSKCVK